MREGKVRHVIAMDGTPLWFAKNELWYGQPYFEPESVSYRIKHKLTRGVFRRAFHLLSLS